LETCHPAGDARSDGTATRLGEPTQRQCCLFHVDGELLPPVDFEGVRTGTFSQESMHLMVQAAVPPDAVDDERAVLLGLLREAVVEAETFARQNGAAADLNEVRGIVDAMPED
jgi:hypothetical protein